MPCTSTQFPYHKTTTFSYNVLSLFCPHKQLWLSQSVTFASFNTLRIPPHCPTNYPSANAQVLCSAPTSLLTALALCSCFASLKAGYGSIPVSLSICTQICLTVQFPQLKMLYFLSIYPSIINTSGHNLLL